MRILHVAPSLARAYGGPTQSLAGYVRAARAAGADVAVAGPHPPAEDEGWIGEALSGAEVRLFPSAGRGAFTASPALLRWLRGEAKAYDAVHVHGLWNPVSTLASRSAIARGLPVVIRPFGTLSRYTFAHRRTLLKRAYRLVVEGRNLRRAAALHFTTAAERDEAAWHGIDFTGRSWVIPPPLPAGGAVSAARRNGGPPLVVCVCRLNPIKNLEVLLEAWARLAGGLPGARLVVAGSGDAAYAASLRERAAALGVADRVEFPGFVAGREKADLLARAHLFVLPSRHENFGMSVVEALSAGLPVVVSPEVQLAPLVAEHGVGAVAPAEPEALAAAVRRALEDRAWREEAGRRAPALVAELFSEEAVGASLLRMYRAVAARSH